MLRLSLGGFKVKISVSTFQQGYAKFLGEGIGFLKLMHLESKTGVSILLVLIYEVLKPKC